MAMSVPQPERWTARLLKQLPRVLLILAVVLLVIAILFVIVYGVGIHHHHSSTTHGAVAAFAPML